jgi:hypothetical protein
MQATKHDEPIVSVDWDVNERDVIAAALCTFPKKGHDAELDWTEHPDSGVNHYTRDQLIDLSWLLSKWALRYEGETDGYKITVARETADGIDEMLRELR